MSRWLLVRGLPRDPRAGPHLMAMLVSAVATVLLVRAFLALAGYPRIGGGGLHIAHVLWGGLLMVAGLVLLLSFAGPVVRPVAAVLSGTGLGLFIDEVGKFVTSDNNYFYRPAAALMYLIVVGLVLVVHMLHGRRPHHPSEHLAAAVDQAVAGVVGGFTARRRVEVQAQLRQAEGAPGLAEARALVRAVPDDPVELVDPLRLVNVRRGVHRVRRIMLAGRVADALPAIVAAVLVVEVLYALASFGPPLYRHPPGAPGPVPLGLGLLSSLAGGVLVVLGLTRLRRDRVAGYRWFVRALLVNLLLTRVFEFDLQQFLAVVSVLVDVALLAIVTATITYRARAVVRA